jgi:hypothetical protein
MNTNNLQDDSLYEKALIVIVIIFGSISAATMMFFCISLTTNTVGQVITAFAGLGIVLAQYVFAAKIQQDKSNGHYDAVTIVVTTLIFIASILGTWSWIESEFNTNTKNSTQSSDRYLDNRALIAMKTITAQSHIDQAKEYTEKGNYTTQAKNSTKEADKVLAEIEALMKNSTALPTTTTGNSSQDMAAMLGKWRWLVWLALALIIDLCTVIAIIELRKLKATKVALESLNVTGTLSSGSIATIQPEQLEILGDSSKQHKQFTTIVAALKSESVKPGKNAIQKQFNLGTATVDKVFEQLTMLNVIKRTEGKRTYELVSNENT